MHRSPGIAFESSLHLNGKTLYSFRIIPDRGSWLEVQFDTSDLLYIYLDRRKRRRKFLATTFLRAIGYGSDEALVKLFYAVEETSSSATNSKTNSWPPRCSSPTCATARSPWPAPSSR